VPTPTLLIGGRTSRLPASAAALDKFILIFLDHFFPGLLRVLTNAPILLVAGSFSRSTLKLSLIGVGSELQIYGLSTSTSWQSSGLYQNRLVLLDRASISGD
jgi:hypothetical protein